MPKVLKTQIPTKLLFLFYFLDSCRKLQDVLQEFCSPDNPQKFQPDGVSLNVLLELGEQILNVFSPNRRQYLFCHTSFIFVSIRTTFNFVSF